jgi:hypothetical protein
MSTAAGVVDSGSVSGVVVAAAVVSASVVSAGAAEVLAALQPAADINAKAAVKTSAKIKRIDRLFERCMNGLLSCFQGAIRSLPGRRAYSHCSKKKPVKW